MCYIGGTEGSAVEEHRKISGKTIHPSVWERVTAISSLTFAIVGIVALAIAGTQIHEMREEAKVQHLTAFVDKWDSPEWNSIRKSLAQKRVDTAQQRLRPIDVDDPPMELYDELDFCEDIGLLTERGYLDRHDVWNEFGDWLFYLYADARPLLDSEQRTSPAEFKECTNLVESMRLIEAKEDASADDHPSENDIYATYMGDLDSEPGQPAIRGRRPKKP
jgi:hypothetical protein